MDTFLREEYVSRINRVIDYIESHLEEELFLRKLAQVAHFSPFHFHRIFKGIVGEPLNQFIQRIRLEKAATKLIENEKLSITEIAFECGFSSSSSFARAFKDYFTMSATEWRKKKQAIDRKNGQMKSNIGKEESNVGKDTVRSSGYIGSKEAPITRRKNMVNAQSLEVEVQYVPQMTVAYIRHIGPYKGDTELFGKLFNQLFRWAGPRDLLKFPETKVLAIYHDNPDVTDESRLRMSVCITVPEDSKVDGEVGKMALPGGKYAIAHFEIDASEYEEAWNALYGTWLPESGYQPDDRPSFELYLNDPNTHPEHKHIVDIYMPVKPL